MHTIHNTLDHSLTADIQSLFQENKHFFDTKNEKINYINIFHHKWKENKYTYFIDKLIQNSPIIAHAHHNFDPAYCGFIQSYPQCDDQFWHYDYFGKSITYFIPLVDLDESNGTEFLHFTNPEHYEKYFADIFLISNMYKNNEDIIKYLEEKCHLVHHKDYTFQRVHAQAYSVLELPHYVFHRGAKNYSSSKRLMMHITFFFKDIEGIDLSDDVFIPDAELDDSMKDVILKNRSTLQYTPKNVQIMKKINVL